VASIAHRSFISLPCSMKPSAREHSPDSRSLSDPLVVAARLGCSSCDQASLAHPARYSTSNARSTPGKRDPVTGGHRVISHSRTPRLRKSFREPQGPAS
jgi:hypothetical protein